MLAELELINQELLEPAGMKMRLVADVETRLRPIAMTTLTTVFGLAPLVFLPGAGTELYRGVGAIVLFSVLGTAVVSLTFLPALTVMVLSWREKPLPPTAEKPCTTSSDAQIASLGSSVRGTGTR